MIEERIAYTEKLKSREFRALWSKINSKSVFVVDFDTDELVRKCITSLNGKLRVSKIYFKVETGTMDTIQSKESLLSGASCLLFTLSDVLVESMCLYAYNAIRAKKYAQLVLW